MDRTKTHRGLPQGAPQPRFPVHRPGAHMEREKNLTATRKLSYNLLRQQVLGRAVMESGTFAVEGPGGEVRESNDQGDE